MSSGEGGSWFYGLILIIAGAFLIVNGILNLVGWNPLVAFAGTTGSEAALRAAATSGSLDLLIAGWAIIGGVGLIKDQEWGWGISLVILSYVIVKFLSDIIQAISAMIAAPALAIYSINVWIYVILFIIAAFGIAYLLITKKKYA
ncbi:MAG: hypothetical protein ACTSVY_08915 [Candidatus Helarchaeota archaeon]